MVLTTQLRRALTVAGLALVAACGAGAADPDPEPSSEAERYTYERATRDGIGKYYMGREVSQVMGHLAAG